MASDDFRQGARAGIVAAISSAPFGIIFGALAIDNGLTPFEAVLMSATLYAGASQIVGVELFGENIPAWAVILSVFAVNFRHILYSAALTPLLASLDGKRKALAFFFLIDAQFAESLKRADRRQPVTLRWYLTMALIVYVCWVATTLAGALFGKLIGNPHALGLDILPAVYFLGMVVGFHKRVNFYPIITASAVTSVIAFNTIGSPWHVSAGAAAGILVACLMAPSARPAVAPIESEG